MLKHNFVFAVSLVAMFIVGIGSARADIPSTVYVQQGVNSAKTAADNAQTSANNANTAASNAQASANTAQAAAEAAQASADEAAASAQTANDAVATKVTANTAITGATKAKITYDSKGLVTGGADLEASDIPTLAIGKISGLQDALDAKVPTAQGSTNKNKAVITDTNGNITTGTIATGMIANGAVTAAKTSGVIGSIPSGSATSTTYATIWVE